MSGPEPMTAEAAPAAGAMASAEHGTFERVGLPSHSPWRFPVIAVVLALLPWVVPSQALAVNILIYGLYATGFNLLFGYTGLLSFGHAAFLGAGAYGTGIALVYLGLGWAPAILVGIFASGMLSLALGALSIRSRGIYFSMVTLALAQLVYYVAFQASDWTGGENGLRGFTISTLHIGPWALNFLDPLVKYYFVFVFVVAALWLVSRLLASPFGAAMEAVRENETRALACGFDVKALKLGAFVISGLLCGLAGSPRRAASVDRADRSAILSDLRHRGDDGFARRRRDIYRPLRRRHRLPPDRRHRLDLDATLAARRRHRLHRRGVVPPARYLGHAGRATARGAQGTTAVSDSAISSETAITNDAAITRDAAILVAEGIGKRYGAFTALEGVDVAFARGKLTAVIGPNGAGKSTFFSILSGMTAPSSGRILFEGADIAGTKPHRFARMGISRSYQITNLFPQLSVHENVRLAAQAIHAPARFGVWRSRTGYPALDEDADALLDDVGLTTRRNRVVATLAHGEQRALEIAVALAAKPKLLLLDEPTAGMSPEETREMMDLIARLASERTVLLVEHKMKLIMGLADHIVVLHQGRLLAQGKPDAIRADADVRRVYLGEGRSGCG